MHNNINLDAVGFGALNVDLTYRIDNFKILEEKKKGIEPGGEYIVAKPEFNDLLKLVEKHGSFVVKSGGGQAANTMFALANMGYRVGFVGKVGNDTNSQFIINSLNGVDTSRILKNSVSGVCLIIIDETNDRTIFVAPNANDSLASNEIDKKYLNKIKFLHLTSFIGVRPLQAQINLVNNLHVKISFDPGEIYCRKGMRGIEKIIHKTYILFVTEKEINYLTGFGYYNGAKFIVEQGVKIVACKMGNKGSYIVHEGKGHEIPAIKTKVVDPTGAGDVFAAGFLAGLLMGKPMVDCAKFATLCASESIKGYGREKYPDKHFLEERLKA